MKKPQSLPVEEARKTLADVLDGTQHHGAHVEVTRRGKRAGVVVPPEWYDTAVAALSETPDVTHDVGSPKWVASKSAGTTAHSEDERDE